LHHVLIGEVDPNHDGLEIITAGYSNTVTVIGQYHPDFEMDLTPSGHMVVDEKKVTFKATITSEDYYTDDIDIEVTGLPAGATATFSSDPLILTTNKAVVTITIDLGTGLANGNHTFTVRTTGVAGVEEEDGYININKVIQPSVIGPVAGQEVVKGQSIAYTFEVKNKGNVPDSFNIALTSSAGLDVTPSMSKTPVLQPGQSVNVGVVVKVAKDTKGKTDTLTLKATSTSDGTTMDSAIVTTDLKKPEETSGTSCASTIMATVMLAIAGMSGIFVRRRRK
jgi:uncharacterized membrane protein